MRATRRFGRLTFAGIVVLTAHGRTIGSEPSATSAGASAQSDALRSRLKAYRHRIAYEAFHDGNWDLFVMNADGSNPTSLTRTPDVDEMYPKASPDGTKICFVADTGKGTARMRSVCLMNVDGTGRIVVREKARWPCWRPDGKVIAYLNCKPGPYTTNHAATKGMCFYDLATHKHTPHVNAKIERALCPSWSPDGKWFVCTAAGGMGYGFSIVAFEANGTGHGLLVTSKRGAWQCRPDFGPDGRRIAYAKATGTGPKDKIFMIESAGIDLTGPKPKLTDLHQVATTPWPTELYHADWSSDGEYIVYARGPREMSRMKPQRAVIAIEAPGWNICVANAKAKNEWVALTTDGSSNKEPDWVFVK